ncbi:MAG TPA: phosphoglucosamine mutase, partial [Bacillota bacterium]|nr:phosphoglucosamine mutase [Bacillota bacterium]
SIIHDCYGIMVTASHNPYHDNGIKIFNRGKKTIEQEEQVIEDVIDRLVTLDEIPGGSEVEFFNPLTSYMSLYENVITRFNGEIVLDLANGATIKSAKHVFNKISSDVDFIGDNPNGKNINEGVGSTHLDNLVEYVVNNKKDIGFAFDGDGDRVLTVTSTGKVVDGDLMIYIFARYLKEKNLLDNDLVVLTKMSNLGIIEALESHGIRAILTDIGDKYVIKAMEEYGAILGGENSGHVINKHLFISGDGVLNASFMIKVINEMGLSLDQFVEEVTFYPDRLLNLRGVDKSLVKHHEIIALVNDIEKNSTVKVKS